MSERNCFFQTEPNQTHSEPNREFFWKTEPKLDRNRKSILHIPKMSSTELHDVLQTSALLNIIQITVIYDTCIAYSIYLLIRM